MEKILNILDLPVNVDTAGLAEWGILDSPYQERDVKLKNFNEGEYFRMALYRVLQHIYETPDFSIDPDDEQKHDDDEPPLDWSVYHPEGL